MDNVNKGDGPVNCNGPLYGCEHPRTMAELREQYNKARKALDISAMVADEVLLERQRQDEKWGEQNHHPMEWLTILGEEVGEANKAALEAHFKGYGAQGDWSNYRAELIQVAAVAVAMVECLDRGKEMGVPSV